ncbi:GNAT family N-acetyltransferase [Limibacter armeniacum]|uniref:GNAT family N-acetyltransferase n=1 Tax=Limibacter armeniacum TaxID=466084 RepID=UPI002FE59A96
MKNETFNVVEPNQSLLKIRTFPVMHTLRTNLRPLVLPDADRLYEIYSDREAMKYRASPPMRLPEDAYTMIDESLEGFRDLSKIRWAIADRNNSELIGTGGFMHFENSGWLGEIGYSLDKNYWGVGIMTEVVIKLLEFGFEKLELESITATCFIKNTRSVNMLAKLGFEEIERFSASGNWYSPFANAIKYELKNK